jgi:hypothetical protein
MGTVSPRARPAWSSSRQRYPVRPVSQVHRRSVCLRQGRSQPASQIPGFHVRGPVSTRASSSIVTHVRQHSHRIGSVQASIRMRNGDDSPIDVISSASSSSPPS